MIIRVIALFMGLFLLSWLSVAGDV
jgi:hypothetical protein